MSLTNFNLFHKFVAWAVSNTMFDSYSPSKFVQLTLTAKTFIVLVPGQLLYLNRLYRTLPT